MTNSEILQKAFNKANKNGWGRDNINYEGDLDPRGLGWDFMFSVIFSHPFAKAFWGENAERIMYVDPITEAVVYRGMPRWQYHLTQMVLEEEPLKYIQTFL